jgi:hypothetical protein
MSRPAVSRGLARLRDMTDLAVGFFPELGKQMHEQRLFRLEKVLTSPELGVHRS